MLATPQDSHWSLKNLRGCAERALLSCLPPRKTQHTRGWEWPRGVDVTLARSHGSRLELRNIESSGAGILHNLWIAFMSLAVV